MPDATPERAAFERRMVQRALDAIRTEELSRREARDVNPGFLTTAEVAAMAHLDPETLLRYCHRVRTGWKMRDQMPTPLRLGRTLLWPEDQVNAWLDARHARRHSTPRVPPPIMP